MNNVQNVPIKQTKHCGDNQYIYKHIYIVFHMKMSVIAFKRIIKKGLVRCQYGNIKNCGIVDASYKN